VNRAGQFYYCFGCGKGGDVFSFLMDISGMSFLEAVEQLAERAGLEMPRRIRTIPATKNRRIIAANLAAAEIFSPLPFRRTGKAGMDTFSGEALPPKPFTLSAWDSLRRIPGLTALPVRRMCCRKPSRRRYPCSEQVRRLPVQPFGGRVSSR